jgi:hypothetical protein
MIIQLCVMVIQIIYLLRNWPEASDGLSDGNIPEYSQSLKVSMYMGTFTLIFCALVFEWILNGILDTQLEF